MLAIINLSKDIEMGSCVSQCDISMDSTTTGRPPSVYCDGWSVMSFVCGMAFLCGSTLVKEPLF